MSASGGEARHLDLGRRTRRVDEQSHQALSGPKDDRPGYMVNVASYQKGGGYGKWTHIDGWSEADQDRFERLLFS